MHTTNVEEELLFALYTIQWSIHPWSGLHQDGIHKLLNIWNSSITVDSKWISYDPWSSSYEKVLFLKIFNPYSNIAMLYSNTFICFVRRLDRWRSSEKSTEGMEVQYPVARQSTSQRDYVNSDWSSLCVFGTNVSIGEIDMKKEIDLCLHVNLCKNSMPREKPQMGVGM
jgi:hypothetical protein